MNHYEAVNILDMLNAIGEDAVKNILSDFSCPKNFEIESFVKQMKKVSWQLFSL